MSLTNSRTLVQMPLIHCRKAASVVRMIRALVIATFGLWVTGSSVGNADDWPAFLGPNGDSKSSETQWRLDNWFDDGPPVRWVRPLGESYSIGSVSGGRYYQFDYQRRNKKAVLLCLNAKSGEPVWEYSYNSNYIDLYNYSSGPRTSPVIDGDRVYIFGVEGMLKCLDCEDGALIWEVDTTRKFGVIQNFFGVGSTPVVYDDLLLVMVGGSPQQDQSAATGLDQVTGNGSGIVALDKRTGELRYKFSDGLASYATLRIVRRPGRDWCFAFMRHGLLAFDPRNGTVDFDFPWRAKILESVNASCPVIWKDRVFISETYGPGSALLRFSTRNHELLWQDDPRRRQKAMQTHWNTPIYHEGYLYGSSGRHTNNAELRCIDAETGEVTWSEPGLGRASLLYLDHHLICLSELGDVRLLRTNPEKYDLVTEFRPTDADGNPLLKYPAWAAPIVSDGLLFMRGRDRLACFQLQRKTKNE